MRWREGNRAGGGETPHPARPRGRRGAEIDESFWGQYEKGDRVTIRTSGGQHTEGQVRLIKALMGKKNVFARSATERMDLKIFETWIELPEDKDWPVGMEVTVEIGD